MKFLNSIVNTTFTQLTFALGTYFHISIIYLYYTTTTLVNCFTYTLNNAHFVGVGRGLRPTIFRKRHGNLAQLKNVSTNQQIKKISQRKAFKRF